MLHPSSDLYGASRVLLQSAIFLKEEGYQPVLVISRSGPLKEAFEAQGIKVFIKPLAILRRKYFNLPGLLNRWQSFRAAKRELSALIESEKIDLIYTNTAAIWVSAIMAKRYKLRHIWHLHEIIERPKFLTRFIGYLAKYSSAELVVVSDAVKQHWRSVLADRPIHRIYNGFDFSYLDKEEKAQIPNEIIEANLTIGMIARVHFWKGQTYFLEIAHALKSLGVEAKYMMVGDAYPGNEYLYDEINQKRAELGLDVDVMDLGYRQDIGHILENLDLFVLPSTLPDPLPTTVLEAMSKGKPVAATAHGGALEMVEDQVTGIHIPWDDAQKAAEKIRSMLIHREWLTTYGKNGELRLHQYFSMESFKTNIIALIEQHAAH